ncbi:MAG: LCP family protein [Coriobacteriia bacterium]|nr:LCP family protein [Coriobacteriia bacterium]MBN2840854.1 LCP family protein [Coriobacteriia bacterium]
MIAAGLLVLAVIAAGATYVYSTLHSAGRMMNQQPGIDERLSEVLEAREKRKPFNVLLLGSDMRPWESESRADTIIVARVDVEAGKVWLLSIPRDTRAEIPGHGVGKINGANFYGGPSLMVETVSQTLGIPIHHYMSVDLTGFQKVVDAVGGVWIDVDVEIDDWRAASHSPGYRAKNIKPGYQLLDGEHALTYVRSRDFPDADFTRMRHQQVFFKALADQMTKVGNVLKIPSIVREMAEYMSTDMSMGDMIDLASALRDIGSANIETATLVGEWRSPYVWTDEERKAFLIDAMMNGRSFDEEADPEDSVIDPATISVSVRNGAGIEGCAAAAAEILRQAGYAVGEVGNANQFVYDETLVVFQSGHDMAVQVAEALPKARVVESRGMYAFTSDILVVVGKDYTTWNTADTGQ